MSEASHPNLERLAAMHLAKHLEGVAVRSTFQIVPSAPLSDVLELLIPGVLRAHSPEWQRESIDGFNYASAIKTKSDCAQLTGTCILISDQTVTPFRIDICLASPRDLASFRVRLGEAGGGKLGISGPTANTRSAQALLERTFERLAEIDWVYDASLSDGRGSRAQGANPDQAR